jgi:hypothetical protein
MPYSTEEVPMRVLKVIGGLPVAGASFSPSARTVGGRIYLADVLCTRTGY